MKTNNYQIELMTPGQIDKDVAYNESMTIIDQFLHNSINGFIETVAGASIEAGTKWIVKTGEQQHNIAYCPSKELGVRYLKPAKGMVIFCQKDKIFYNFTETGWQPVSASHSTEALKPSVETKKSFIGIREAYTINAKEGQHYLYVMADTELSISGPGNELLVVFKQSTTPGKIIWPGNVLWPQGKAPVSSDKVNSMEMVKLYKLAESDHWLGVVFGQDYNF